MVLEEHDQRLVHILEFSSLFLSDFGIVENIEVIFSDGLHFALFVLGHVLEHKFVNGIVKDENLISFFDITLQNGGFKDTLLAVSRQV